VLVVNGLVAAVVADVAVAAVMVAAGDGLGRTVGSWLRWMLVGRLAVPLARLRLAGLIAGEVELLGRLMMAALARGVAVVLLGR